MIKGILTQDEYSQLVKTQEDVEKDFKESGGRLRQMIAKRILNQEETEELYGVFQQATIGDCNDWKIIKTAGQRLFDMGSKGKHSTWVSFRGLSKCEAMMLYSSKIQELIAKYGVVFPDDHLHRAGSSSSIATASTYLAH